MDENEYNLLKKVIAVLKNTELDIAELKKDKSREQPIQSDLVKTKKAMAYENILSEVRKHSEKKKKERSKIT